MCPVIKMREFTFKELFMSNRVLNRSGARELTPEEMDRIAGGGACLLTVCGVIPHFSQDDVRCIE